MLFNMHVFVTLKILSSALGFNYTLPLFFFPHSKDTVPLFFFLPAVHASHGKIQ